MARDLILVETQAGKMIRKNTYSIEDTFHRLGKSIYSSKKTFIDFDGEQIKANSQRYVVFKEKGCKCVKCGLKATYFALERHQKDDRYHLNLYGKNKKGQEILFTKDHIMPKSKKGASKIENYQTMCSNCNSDKADKVEEKITKG